MPELRTLGWALAGNSVIGIGAGTATLVAFAPTLPVLERPHFVIRACLVAVGFALFFSGYHVTQAGTYRDRSNRIRTSLLPDPLTSEQQRSTENGPSRPLLAVRGACIVVGVLALGAGMRLFAMTIQSWDASLGVLTGVVCITGYIFGHIGINWVVL